jgi:hypothetical protein
VVVGYEYVHGEERLPTCNRHCRITLETTSPQDTSCRADYAVDVSPQIDLAPPAPASTHDDATMAFRHLLHEVASHVTGLGLTLEMLGEPELTVEDTSTMVRTARGALDDLRHLVADVGEMTRFLHRHGPLQADSFTARDVLTDLASGVAEPTGAETPLDVVLDVPLCADRVVIAFILHVLAKSCRRLPGVEVTTSAASVGDGFVRIEIAAQYGERPQRRTLEKAPLVVDHFCSLVARDVGGRFVREQSPAGQRVGFVLPVAS